MSYDLDDLINRLISIKQKHGGDITVAINDNDYNDDFTTITDSSVRLIFDKEDNIVLILNHQL